MRRLRGPFLYSVTEARLENRADTVSQRRERGDPSPGVVLNS